MFLVVSCKKHVNHERRGLERSVKVSVANDVYNFITAYKAIEGDYPSELNDLKGFYYGYNVERDRKSWDDEIQDKWEYIVPDPTKKRQIILREKNYKYGIHVEVDFVGGEMRLIDVTQGTEIFPAQKNIKAK